MTRSITARTRTRLQRMDSRATRSSLRLAANQAKSEGDSSFWPPETNAKDEGKDEKQVVGKEETAESRLVHSDSSNHGVPNE